jgi:hypothetical protein
VGALRPIEAIVETSVAGAPEGGIGADKYTRLDAWTQERVKERRCEVGKAGTVTMSGLNAVPQGMRTLAARRGPS